jgi:polyphenol oxidase
LANPQRRHYPSRVLAASAFLNPLNAIPGIRAAYYERVVGLPIHGDRDEAMQLLRPHHAAAVIDFAGPSALWCRAEQVHGTQVTQVPSSLQILTPDGLPCVPAADGLVTDQAGVVLTIYTADCGVIWLADRETGAIGLLHSGKKGTAGNIFQTALDVMACKFGTLPQNVTAVLGPCIRPPDYEIDIPAEIANQASQAGLGDFSDCDLNTAADLERFYSYRRELGKTGRMMALMVKDYPV